MGLTLHRLKLVSERRHPPVFNSDQTRTHCSGTRPVVEEEVASGFLFLGCDPGHSPDELGLAQCCCDRLDRSESHVVLVFAHGVVCD